MHIHAHTVCLEGIPVQCYLHSLCGVCVCVCVCVCVLCMCVVCVVCVRVLCVCWCVVCVFNVVCLWPMNYALDPHASIHCYCNH